MVLAFYRAGSYLEVGKAVTAVFAVLVEGLPWGVPCVPHRPYSSGGHDIESVSPETASPVRGTQWQVLHLRFLTVAHVRQSLCLCCY